MSTTRHTMIDRLRAAARRWYAVLPLVCVPLLVVAQGNKDLRAKADALFAKGEYAQAFEPYQTLVSNDMEDFDLNFRYGVCALYGGADKDEAIKFIKRSTLAPVPPPLAWYFLGKAYHLTYHFKDAIAAYDRFQGTADKKTLAEHPVAALLLQCRNGENLLSNLKEIDVHNKMEVNAEDFFRFYDLGSIGGKIVVTPEELLTSLDKKDKERGLVYLPDKGGPIYFSSRGKNNDTGRDIYRTELMPDGSFATPTKLAGYINTDQDENYPFMAPDGKSFYFCSRGHNSMGGYDVFKSMFDKGMDVFGAPVNMDFAVNTPDDDVLYLTDPEGREACFASARDSKQGMLHVYRVSTTQAPVNITVLKGTFASQFDANDRKAHVVVVDALTQETVADVRTDHDGGYVLSLPRTGRYKFMVEAGPGGRTHVGMVEVPRSEEPRAYRQEMSLVDQGGEKLLIKNYFDQPLEEDIIALALEEIKKRAKLDVGEHVHVAEAPVPETKAGDAFTRAGFSGDVTKPEALRMAAEDAEALARKEEELAAQEKAAYSIAQDNLAKADAAAQKAEALVDQANAATDEAARNALMTDAARQRQNARMASQRARAAFQAGQVLDAERTATALQAQKAARLNTDLTQVLAGGDENASVIKLVELKKRMDEKSAPDAAVDAAEKMRRSATDSEHEAAVLMQRANDGRSEESELADRVARKKREEADAKGNKKETLARERADLEQQLTALHEENDKAFAKARVAERASTVARGQAQLARKLTALAGAMRVNEVPADQVAPLGQRIGNVSTRMDELALDERYDAAISEEVHAAERTAFDWDVPTTDATADVSSPTVTAQRDATNDAQHRDANTITMDQGALGDRSVREGGNVPPLEANARDRQNAQQGSPDQVTTQHDATNDAQHQQGNTITMEQGALGDRTVRNGGNVPPINTGAADQRAAQNASTSNGAPDNGTTQTGGDVADRQGHEETSGTERSNVQGITTQGNDAAPAHAGVPDGNTTGGPITSTQQQQGDNTRSVTPTDTRATDQRAQEQVAATNGTQRNTGSQEQADANDRAREEGRVVEEAHEDPAERAFVLSNELAELNQLHTAEKNKQRRDSLDVRIAEVQRELRATADNSTAGTTGTGHADHQEAPAAAGTNTTNGQQQQSTGASTAVDNKPPFAFTPTTTDQEVLNAVFPQYQDQVARIRKDIIDPQDQATSVHGLELMLADSLDAESARQSTFLAQHPDRSSEILPRLDRLRRIKEEHLAEAERVLQEAKRQYAASETNRLENDAIAAQGSSEPTDGGARVHESATPHNDEYIDVDPDPEYVYTSSVEYRSADAVKESGAMEQHLNDLYDLEDRIDSLEDVLEGMPEGRSKERLREKADRLIDDRMIARTEIGQATAYYTRAEFKAVQDSAKKLTSSTAALGLPLTEPTLQLAGNLEGHAAGSMEEAARVRKKADRTEDIVLRDSLLRVAYAQELEAIREMDRALTVRNFMLSDRYVRGAQLDYAAIEQRMFGGAPVEGANADAVAAAQRDANAPTDTAAAPPTADAQQKPVPGNLYKEFMGTDTSASPLDRGHEGDISSLVTTADQAAARARELERASVSAADRANALQDSVALVKKSQRARYEQEAARMRLVSDSLHREAQAASVLERDLTAHDEAQAKEASFRKRLMKFYYLDEEQQSLVLNEQDRSRYFEARSMALEQREQAALASEQAANTKKLADAVLQQSKNVLAGQTSSDSLTLEGSARAQRLADQAIMLTHRADSLNALADRLAKAATVNESQSAAILQGLDPQRGTEIMAMEQQARRVEPALAQARSTNTSEPTPATAATTNAPADAGANTAEQARPNTTQANTTAPDTTASASVAVQEHHDAPAGTVHQATSSVEPVASVPPAGAAVPPALLAPLANDEFSMSVPPSERPTSIPMDAPMPAGVVFKVQVGAFKHEIPAEVLGDMSPVAGETVAGGLKRYTVGMFTSAQNAAKATEQVRARGFRDAFVVAYQDGKRVSLAQAIRATQPEAAAATADAREAHPPVRIVAPLEAAPAIAPADTALAADQDVLAKYPGSAEQLMAQFAPPADATAYYNDPSAAPARQVETVKGLFFTVQVGVYSRPTPLDRLFNITPLNSERTENLKIRYTTGVFVDMDKARARKDETVGLGVKDAFITAYLNGKRIPMRDARALIAKFGPSVFVDPAILTR